jgi:phosphoribosylglycinamide formyltransferase-1
VLASGRGSNLGALLDAVDQGRLPATVALVVSNNAKAGALQTARERGIAARHISAKTDADPGAALGAALAEHRIDLLALAGYLRKLDPRVCEAYAGRAVNVHPAPLPRFGGQGMYGHHVHEAVLAAGVDSSGPTVHLVTDGYDEGTVLAHRPVPVRPDDTAETLAARVLAAEHDLYWRVIAERFCGGAGS